MTNKLIHRVGINDANYVVRPVVNGRQVVCKVYDTWVGMLRRCYDLEELEKRPTYKGCYVDKEWHSFMSFRAWMLTKDFAGKQLDKDLLIPGNKVYSKDTCVFLSSAVNNFLLESTAIRGAFPIGVSASGKKFIARCRDPFNKIRKYLGTFDTPEEAQLAWKKYKHELALEYAKLETDPQIISALSTRYL